MRLSFRLVAVLAAALTTGGTVAAVVAVHPAASATANMIANPGFESGLSGWSCGTGTAAGGGAHTGATALVGTPAGQEYAECTQTVTVTPNTAYTLSAFVNGSYVFLGVRNGVDASNWTPGTGGAYQQLSVPFTTGAATRSVTVFVHGWYGQPAYQADDVSLPGTGTPPTNPPPTTPPPTTPPPTTPPPTTPPPTTPPPTNPPPTGTLPAHELTGYWQNFVNGATPLRLRDVSSSYDLIAVAFADSDPSRPGGVRFAVDAGLSSALGGYSDADLKADISTLHSRGKRVVISVGGQNGAISVGDATAAGNFATSVFGLMQTFGFDGVDIDLENGITPDAMSQALHTLAGRAGSGLIITMAPETLFMQSPSATYLSLAIKVKDILTVVHTQYYNSGSMNGCDGNVYSQGTVDFITAQACIALQNGLRPDQVALGFPASSSAAGSGFVDPSAVVNAAVDCLTQGSRCGSFHPPRTWPGLRGVMTWSVNWDRSNGSAFSTTVKQHLATLP
jgi:chitinase